MKRGVWTASARPWMLCPYGCDREIKHGLIENEYHCPGCMRCVPLELHAHAVHRRAAELTRRPLRKR